jgi:hypothetical protein
MKSPAMTATAPPPISHIEWSVGFPVKVRETSELNECDSLNPKMSRITPNAMMAIPMMLFITKRPRTTLLPPSGLYLQNERETRYAAFCRGTRCNWNSAGLLPDGSSRVVR